MRSTLLRLALLVAFLPGPTPPARAEEAAGGVLVRRLEGANVAGRLVALDAERVTVAPPQEEAPVALPLAEVREVLWIAPPLPAPEGPRWRAVLVGGDEVAGTWEDAEADAIRLRVLGLAAPLRLTFDQIRSLERLRPSREAAAPATERHPPVEGTDVVYDLRGDEVRGLVADADAEALHVEGERGGVRRIPWDAVHVLHLDNPPLEAPAAERVEVELRDGSRWLAAAPPTLSADGAAVSFRPRGLAGVTLAPRPAEVAALRRQDARFVYASQLPWRATYRHPYEDPPEILRPAMHEALFGARADRRALGGPLRLAGTAWRHGFGVNSGSRVEVPLDGAFARFEAWFGIDDSVLEEREAQHLKAEVDARVLGDGRVLWEAKGVVKGEAPRRVGPLDVSGVKVLTLVVEEGGDLHGLDRADWVDPVLVRK